MPSSTPSSNYLVAKVLPPKKKNQFRSYMILKIINFLSIICLISCQTQFINKNFVSYKLFDEVEKHKKENKNKNFSKAVGLGFNSFFFDSSSLGEIENLKKLRNCKI